MPSTQAPLLPLAAASPAGKRGDEGSRQSSPAKEVKQALLAARNGDLSGALSSAAAATGHAAQNWRIILLAAAVVLVLGGAELLLRQGGAEQQEQWQHTEGEGVPSPGKSGAFADLWNADPVGCRA